MVKVQLNKNYKYLICGAALFIYLRVGQGKIENIEEVDIASGIGYGFRKEVSGNGTYVFPINSMIYSELGRNTNTIHTGKAITPGQTRANRQLRNDKKFFIGTEKVYIFEDSTASFGIKGILDILFKNPAVNEDGYCAVCIGNVKDYFNHQVEGYDSPSDYIAGMIKNSSGYNFFGKEYAIRDSYLMVESEGRNLVLPYIELSDKEFKINGAALFKKDKLVTLLDIKDTRIMNMLRENKSTGILTIQRSPEQFINMSAKVKKKVKCVKEGGKYKFEIDLKIQGDIVSNKLYKDLPSKVSVKKELEKDMEKKTKEACEDFLNKMKNQYKVDSLELGRVAAAKYGRGTGVDWNEIVCNSDIKVNVKINVDKVGRGVY